MKDTVVLKMPHGVYTSDLPAEVQEVMKQMGVEEIPSVMPGSQPVDGECLIQALVNADTPNDVMETLSGIGATLVGRYTHDFVAKVPMDATVYDAFIPPIITLDEEGNVLSEISPESLKITSIFAGQELPEGGTWPI